MRGRTPVVRRLWAAPIHPLLAAAYPVVFLFAINAAEQVSLDPLWVPLAAAVGAALLGLVLLGAVVRDWHRAGLMATVLVIGFFGYGHAWNAVSGWLSTQWPLIGVWLTVIGIGLVVAFRSGGRARQATPWLNLVAVFLVAVNAWTVVTVAQTLQAADRPREDLSSLELRPDDPEDLPDVYFIILDRYAGSTALNDEYDFDNEPFLTALESRGFAVARHAHANYIKTPLSLASTLNMEFLDVDALAEEADDGSDREPIHRVLSRRLAVPGALKELGYQYLHVGNWWTPTQSNVDADRAFRYEGQDEFTSVLAQTTLLRALSEPNTAPKDPWDWPVMRENNLYALDTLEEIAGLDGPKYVFAHLVTTHPPYVHNADGSFTGRAQVERLGAEESYRRQLTYANTRMLALVDRIIAHDPSSVIVLQSDEGPFPQRYRVSEWGFNWDDATDAELEEKFGILSAMRAPGADLQAAGFHDAMTPVNTFRILFNARFGTDLELLPDRVWAHENLYRFYEMFEITDRLRY